MRVVERVVSVSLYVVRYSDSWMVRNVDARSDRWYEGVLAEGPIRRVSRSSSTLKSNSVSWGALIYPWTPRRQMVREGAYSSLSKDKAQSRYVYSHLIYII
jgi:hypothetical protein